MALAFVTTAADPNRIGLAFKIEFDSDAQMEEWLDQNRELQSLLSGEMDGLMVKTMTPNTSVSLIRDNGQASSGSFYASMQAVNKFLQSADYDFGRDVGSPGRPNKRVLVLTTSKDRRTGALTARQAAY